MTELNGSLIAGLVLNLRKERFLFTRLVQAQLHKSACRERNQQITKSFVSYFFLLCSGVTFIGRYFLLFTRFQWGGVTGTSFIDWSQKQMDLGKQSGSPLLWIAARRGIGISSRVFVYNWGAATHTTCQRWKVASLVGVEKEECWSSVSCGPFLEVWVLCWVNTCTDEVHTALVDRQVYPALLEDVPHVECVRLQRLLAVPPQRPT